VPCLLTEKQRQNWIKEVLQSDPQFFSKVTYQSWQIWAYETYFLLFNYLWFIYWHCHTVSISDCIASDSRRLDLRFSWRWLWRMPVSGMWHRVVLVWTDVSENRIASIFRVEKLLVRNQHEQSAATCSCWFLTRGFIYPEDGGDTFLQNIGSHKNYMAPHPRKRHSPDSRVIANNELERSRRKWAWLNLRYCPGICLEEARKNFSQDGWWSIQNFN
jgi:hypothetical protein